MSEFRVKIKTDDFTADERADERWHHSVTYGSNADGYWLWCSCGCEAGDMTGDQLDIALAEHQAEP